VVEYCGIHVREESESLQNQCLCTVHTLYTRPYSGEVPMNTALAPSARALSTSVPRRIPPSRYTSQRPLTADTMDGNTSIWWDKFNVAYFINIP
jgi:hypothetical protein